MFTRLSEDQRQVLNIVREGQNVFIAGQGGTGKSFLGKEIHKELTRSEKHVAIICSSGIAGKRRFFLDSDISNKMGRLVTRQTFLVLLLLFLAI